MTRKPIKGMEKRKSWERYTTQKSKRREVRVEISKKLKVTSEALTTNNIGARRLQRTGHV